MRYIRELSLDGRLLAGAVSAMMAMALVACGTTGDTQPDASPTSTDEGAGATTTDVEGPGGELPGTDRFSVISASFDLAELPFLAALDEMRNDGYSIDYFQITGAAEIGIEGVNSGDYQFTSNVFNAVAGAIQQGADLQMFAQRRLNDWSIYVTNDIESCEDLEGRDVAIHSESGFSTALIRSFIEEECPGTEPNYLVIAGSENRYAAMIAGEIDGTALELVDALNIEEEAGDRFHRLGNMREALPDLANTMQVAEAGWADENPGTVQDMTIAILEQHRRVADDPAYLKELADRYPQSVSEQPSDEAVQEYSELFPVNGGMTPDVLEYSLNFFESTGAIEPGLTPEDVADRSYLEAALEELGER